MTNATTTMWKVQVVGPTVWAPSARQTTATPEQVILAQHVSHSRDTIKVEPTIALFGEITPGVFLRRPLTLSIEYENNYWVVSDSELGVYGDAASLPGAVDDYVSSLLDYYYLLADRATRDDADRAQFEKVEPYLFIPER